jgi:hypothetical protein
LRDALPAGLLVATPNGLTGCCDGGTITATAGSNSIILAGASIGPTATCTLSVNVKGTGDAVVMNTVTVTSDQGREKGDSLVFRAPTVAAILTC